MKWVDARARLPEENVRCLVYGDRYSFPPDKQGRKGKPLTKNYIGCAAHRSGVWIGDGWIDVTHWIPLPEPPEESE